MDYYFLKIKIIEFFEDLNENNINDESKPYKTEPINENNDDNYEIEFELSKSKEKYILEIINDNNGNKILSSNYVTLSTSIINDLLKISLYYKKKDERKLIDINKDIIYDEKYMNRNIISELNLGPFFVKFSYMLNKIENLYNIEDIYLYSKKEVFDNDNKKEEKDLASKYDNIISTNNQTKDSIIYDDYLYEEKEQINDDTDIKENTNENIEVNVKSGIYNKIISSDFFDIDVNTDVSKEDEIENKEKNPFKIIKEIAYKIYRNTNILSYEEISLEQEILKEIIKDNLIECFLISGLSKNRAIINNSELYIPQCKHKFCKFNDSYYSQIFFKLNKQNSIFNEINSDLISNLIFPNGIKICHGPNIKDNSIKNRNGFQNINSEFSFNILTDINGKKHYIYSLIFFIKFTFEEFIEYFGEYKNIKNKNNIIFIPFSFSIISKFFDIDNFNIILNDLFMIFSTNENNTDSFDNELIHLIYEVPLPPINSKIKLFLPNTNTEIYSNIYENKIHNNINAYNICFKKYNYNINFILKLFILIILEKRIIFHSYANDKIYLTIESILSLIYPLKWINTYIPLIPESNINILLQSFVPFIIGMNHQLFFNYANKIESMDNMDNIFIINLDTENILPSKKIEDIIKKCPFYDNIQNELIENKNKGILNNEKIKEIFLDYIVFIIGDFEKFTSKLGENILFNQKIFLKNRDTQYESFYKEITSTQLFYQLINEININNNDLYFNEFKEKIKSSKKIKNKKHKIKEIFLNDYYLYPYFFEKNKDIESDIFNFEDEVDIYYNCLDKEHEINYLLNSEGFIRIQSILKNYIPKNLKKYEINQKKFQNKKKKNNVYDTLYDSNISTTENDEDKLENIKNIIGDFYGKVKLSINKIIPQKAKSIINFEENKENISLNMRSKNNNKIIKKQSKYRHRNSLIKMIKEKENINELMEYKEQIIDLLNDFISYILSNQNTDIIFSINELSKLFKYRVIRREFSKILYQKKFERNIEHELTEETFKLLYQTIFSCLINLKNDKIEYKSLIRIIKSMFSYYYIRKNGLGKFYLYQNFYEKNDKFYYKTNLNFWKYYYKLEKYENENNNEYLIDENKLINNIKNVMFLMDVDDDIINFF